MKKAFTLVEIMITVVIVGVLSSIALPMIIGAGERPMASEGVTTLQVLHAAMLRYNLENGSYPSAVVGWDTALQNCSLLDIRVVPKYFNDLNCNSNGIIRIDRSNNDYRLRVLVDGSFECRTTTGAFGNAKCANIRSVLPAGTVM